ncbi:MAG: hypothetical protein II727_10140 [Oscillospiraceae bacterium]|nr:hypothetical protein [Oscillospiraceae bacterium]
MKTHLKAILIVLLAALCLAGLFVFDILELPVIVLPSAYPADFSIRYESSIYGQKIVLDTSAGIVERGEKPLPLHRMKRFFVRFGQWS